MVKIQSNVRGIPIENVWYADKMINDKGIIHYKQAIRQLGSKCEEFITVENDLTKSEEEILAGISKNGRYEIRRAERENVTTELKYYDDLTYEAIVEFVNFFVEFWKSKGVDYIYSKSLLQELEAYRNVGALAIGTAKINGNVCVYHTYIVDDFQVRLLHSASLYRITEDVPKSILGMANRLLHKDEMITFKQNGKKVYDWGGAGTDPEVAGITEFKKSFGGTQKIYYDVTIANGLKAKLVSKISEIKNRLRRR